MHVPLLDGILDVWTRGKSVCKEEWPRAAAQWRLTLAFLKTSFSSQYLEKTETRLSTDLEPMVI